MWRLLLSPRWLVRHVVALGCIAGFVALGRWQLGRAQAPHGTAQNFFYAAEWWLFAGCVAFGWLRLLHEDRRPAGDRAAPAEAAIRGPDEMPLSLLRPARAQLSTAEDGEPDRELADYNAYLAWLNAHPRR